MRYQLSAVLSNSILLAVLLFSMAGCRNPSRNPSPSGAGVSGSVHKPAQPAPGGIGFRDVAESLGIKYRWGPHNRSPLSNLDTFGAGCAFVDINQDGFLDIVAVGEPGIRLFLQQKDGHFQDVSTAYGLNRFSEHWTGIAVGDYDGDGWPDLLITGFKCLLLLRNLHGTGFEDTTVRSGLSPTNWGRWGSSAGFADLDGDGTLDLVIANYVPLGPGAKKYCQLVAGVVSGCPPQEYEPDFPHVYRNHNNRFEDLTKNSGFAGYGKALTVTFCDYDRDGKIDVFVGNDGMPSDLFHNLGHFRFRNVGIESGAAFGVGEHPTASMGADWGDYDRDGQWDLVESAFSDEEYTLLRQSHGTFRPVSDEVGIGVPTFKPLGFGTKFLDVDNDGWLDISFVNGHVYDNVQLIDPASDYRQPMMLFHQKNGKFEDLAAAIGHEFDEPMVARGSAVGDFDNDGREDLLVVDYEGTLHLFHNETRTENHWLRLDLRGAQAGNRFAYGAVVELEQGKVVQMRQVSPSSSYLSSSDPRIHFGLGKSAAAETLRVRWPSGRVQQVHGLSADSGYLWNEGQAPQKQTKPVSN